MKTQVTILVAFEVDAEPAALTAALEDIACAMVAQVETLREDHGIEYTKADFEIHTETLPKGGAT